MAAILCHGVSHACGRSCHSVSNISGCCCCDEDSCCYCGSSCCGCGKYMSTLKHICTNPFGIFVTVTVVSNIPPMLIALTEVGNLHFESGDSLCHSSVWLLINFLFCWVHIIASFYIAVSINHRTAAERNKHKRHTMEPKTIFRRAGNLFCYDPFMAAYIIIVVLYVGFLFLPNFLDLDSSGNSSGCSMFIHEKVIATVGFAFAFLGFGLGALALSFGFAYVDATRKNRHEKNTAALNGDGFSTHLSDLDSTTQNTYTTMEEGNGGTKHKGHHSGSRSSNNGSSSHTGSGSRRGRRGGREDTPRLMLEEYVPPMIVYDPTDDGIELLSETETEVGPKPPRHDKKGGKSKLKLNSHLQDHHGNVKTTYHEDTEGETVGFVTDLETDNDELARTSMDTQEHDASSQQPSVLSPASSSKKTTITGHRRTKERKSNTMIAYFADEEDAEPIQSYEVQEETETTTEGVDAITDTDGENYPPPSFETNDIDQAIDLTDNDTDAPVANLDIVLAVSQDPTVSLSLTETDRSTLQDDGSILAAPSVTGSTSSHSAERGSTTSTSSQHAGSRVKSPSLGQASSDPVQRVVDLVSQHSNPRLPDLNSVPTSPQQNRLNQLLSGTRTSSLEYDPASLTYSTSIGTLVPIEPLSFVDGGGNNDIVLPYANLREQSVLESSDGERTDPASDDNQRQR